MRDDVFNHAMDERPDYPTKTPRSLRWGVPAFLAAVALLEILMDVTPPVSRDALIHHLAIPKLYIMKGLFHNFPFSTPSYYPMNLDLLYWAALRLGTDVPAKFIHMAFGLGAAMLVFFHLRRECGETTAWLGSMFFLSTPMIVRLSTEVYVDLGFIFFSTLAVVSLLRWRDEGFRRRWLLLAAVGCGLAMGVKYTGLILLLLLAAGAARLRASAGGGSAGAFRDAVIFIIGSLLLFSPWCIKNFIQTGNPLYPLFPSVLGGPEVISYGPMPGALLYREWLYGEPWWQTLLAPLRMFFQGQDDVPRFFDGVLSPALVLFVPIALWRGGPRHKWLLTWFCVLFVSLVFFTTGDFRIRYILPIVPVMAMLSASGVVSAWRSIQGRTAARAALVLLVAGLMVQNAVYAVNLFEKTDPIPLLTGKESRDAYLHRRLPVYGIMTYANATLPADAKVLFLFMGNRGYYLDREYIYDTYFSGESLRRAVASSRSPEDILKHLESQGVTHILINTKPALDFFHDNLEPENERLFHSFLRDCLEGLAADGNYRLLRVKAGCSNKADQGLQSGVNPVYHSLSSLLRRCEKQERS